MMAWIPLSALPFQHSLFFGDHRGLGIGLKEKNEREKLAIYNSSFYTASADDGIKRLRYTENKRISCN